MASEQRPETWPGRPRREQSARKESEKETRGPTAQLGQASDRVKGRVTWTPIGWGWPRIPAGIPVFLPNKGEKQQAPSLDGLEPLRTSVWTVASSATIIHPRKQNQRADSTRGPKKGGRSKSGRSIGLGNPKQMGGGGGGGVGLGDKSAVGTD